MRDDTRKKIVTDTKTSKPVAKAYRIAVPPPYMSDNTPISNGPCPKPMSMLENCRLDVTVPRIFAGVLDSRVEQAGGGYPLRKNPPQPYPMIARTMLDENNMVMPAPNPRMAEIATSRSGQARSRNDKVSDSFPYIRGARTPPAPPKAPMSRPTSVNDSS